MDYDWNATGIVIVRLFVLSLILQLALESVYRYDGWTRLETWFRVRFNMGLKFPVALGLAWALCRRIDLDVVADLYSAADGIAGYLTTALCVCGGTAPFLAVFSKIEAMREASRTVVVQAQAARANGGTA